MIVFVHRWRRLGNVLERLGSARRAPRGGWTLALTCDQANADLLVIAPGHGLSDPPAARLHAEMYVWMSDGTAFIYWDHLDVRRHDVATGEERALLHIRSADDLAISPDGKTLYITAERSHGHRELITNLAERR